MNIHFGNEIARTRPDIILFTPETDQGVDPSSLSNEHLLVEHFAGSQSGLFAIWTQSSFEGNPDQHIMFATSGDSGETWSAPRTIVGRATNTVPARSAAPTGGYGMASWAFPLQSRSGRIYVIYNRHCGVNDVFTHTTGLMGCVYSDDKGASWSAETIIPMPRSIWDNPDPQIPANWIVWQKPVRLADGRYLAGMTRWISPAVYPENVPDQWWAKDSHVEFIRFENTDSDPAPADLRLTWIAANESALRISLSDQYPRSSCLQEPGIVLLPDKRLFCVMRSMRGSPYFSVGSEDGSSWTPPQPLRQYDGGPVLPHPLSPCPIYPAARAAANAGQAADTAEGTAADVAASAGEFVLCYHNHDGHFLNHKPTDTSHNRRPVCLARGVFREGAAQPVWFSEPWFFMDNAGVKLLRTDLAMYASTTFCDKPEGIILWYPERKCFLLGKKIPLADLQAIPVPEPR